MDEPGRPAPAASDPAPTKSYLTTEELGAHLGIRASWLKQDRAVGGAGIGPPFLKIGHLVRYDLDEVRAWLAARTVVPGQPRQAS